MVRGFKKALLNMVAVRHIMATAVQKPRAEVSECLTRSGEASMAAPLFSDDPQEAFAMRSTQFIHLITLALLASTATPALAQTAPAADEAGLGEIIVTAQRRDENLQDVPLSVTAIGGEKLGNILQKP